MIRALVVLTAFFKILIPALPVSIFIHQHVQSVVLYKKLIPVPESGKYNIISAKPCHTFLIEAGLIMTVHEDLIQDRLRLNSMKFPPELEKLFNDDFFEKSLSVTRYSLVMAFLLYAGFGILDFVIAPAAKQYIWGIRFYIICPLIMAAFIYSFTGFFRGIHQYILFLLSVSMGLGIIAMPYAAPEPEVRLFYYYYAGLILVIMWSCTMVRLRFRFATAACWIILLGYEITSIYMENILSSPELMRGFINNNFFFISAIVIGMTANYYIESYTRKDFLQRRLITESRDMLGREKEVLKKEIEERERIEKKLLDALANVKELKGLLPICANCKKVRTDEGYWEQIETYIKEQTGTEFSHGICPDCIKKLYPEISDRLQEEMHGD